MKIIEIITSTCSICKMIKPMITKVIGDSGIDFEVYTADIPEEAANVQDLLDDYSIKSVPAFFFMKNDKIIGTHFGAITMPQLKKNIEDLKNYEC